MTIRARRDRLLSASTRNGTFTKRFLMGAVAFALALHAHPAGIPLLERIAASAPDSTLHSTITGSAGAVPANASVVVLNMELGHYEVAQAAADGSFQIKLFAPAGSWVEVKSDTTGVLTRWLAQFTQASPVIDHSFHVLASMPGTVIRVPASPLPDGLSFHASGITQYFPAWTIEGTVDREAYRQGESITIDASFAAFGQAQPGRTPQLRVEAWLIALTRPDGRGTLDQNTFASVLLTPTGLPIERPAQPSGGIVNHQALEADGDRLHASIRVTLPIPQQYPAGYYRPVIAFRLTDVVFSNPRDIPITTFTDNAARHPRNGAHLPIVRVGEPAPPSFYWTLLANTLAGGSRGVIAAEDREHFGISPRVAIQTERFVVPRTDSRSGEAHTYNIEPFALTVALSDRGGPPNPFLIPFRFPSGSLTATIRRPDGSLITAGPSPFRQPLLRSVSTPQGDVMENGGHITDAVQISTIDPAFDVVFTQDGQHTITLNGTIEDIWGNVWSGRGTYVIDVASELTIDTALIPGTPLERGNVITAAVQLIPPVPAKVEMRMRLARNSSRDQMTEIVVRGVANRFGYLRVDPIPVASAGEYRLDVTAEYRDGGRIWVGSKTFGAVVAPVEPAIVAHGKRGIDDQEGSRQTWFSRKDLDLPVGRGHIFFPFHSGDVAWMDNGESDLPVITVQDNDGALSALLPPGAEPGETELRSHFADGVDPHIDPASVDLWAYSYRFASRPLVRIREEISEEGIPAPYWRFNDRYAAQRGSGANGDLPNDFKFQFGGVALHGSALAEPLYAIYGSLFVLVPQDDPFGGTRTFPPFQGNGDGPSGGPLFVLKGEEIDIFFHPTALRAGSILHVGDRASFAGYIAPTLPGKLEILVTSPSGRTATITGQANAIGYFYDPSGDFAVDESGVWQARVKVYFDGVLPSTGGQVQAPYPTGGVPGSREGQFSFYVVDATSPQLEVTTSDGMNPCPICPRFVRPADGPITFTITPPAGLSNVEMHTTTTMPGFILEEGRSTLTSSSSPFTYTYDAQKLAMDFPNLDLHDADGFAGADTITISFLISGTDANGAKKHFARQIVIQGEELQMPEQTEAIFLPRRRPVRR